MQINNEFDMFDVLLEKAEKKEIDHDTKEVFEEGIEFLKNELCFVKMTPIDNGFLIEKGFTGVKVTVEEYDDGKMVELNYEKVDGYREHRDKLISVSEVKPEDLKAAHSAAVGKFKLW